MGATLARLAIVTINITQRKLLMSNRSFDLATTNPEEILARDYNLAMIVQFTQMTGDNWYADDTIVQFTWIPLLHYPVGYVLSPPAAISSRIVVECDQWDLERTGLNRFSITYPDGRGQVFDFKDFDTEDNQDEIPAEKIREFETWMQTHPQEITEIPSRFKVEMLEENMKKNLIPSTRKEDMQESS